MKSIIDLPKIKQRATMANIASIGGMLLLLGFVTLSLFKPNLTTITNLGMLAGIGVAMVGIYFANRWVKKPRPEVSLDKALKSYSEGYRLYHYPRFPCDHILLSPSYVLVLETVNLAGEFTYKNGRWRERMSIGRALRYIVEEYLGDPIKSASDCATLLEAKLNNLSEQGLDIPIIPMVVFTNPGAVIDVSKSPISVCPIAKLKKSLPGNLPRIAPETYQLVQDYLDKLTV
jgi:hypothetical protein